MANDADSLAAQVAALANTGSFDALCRLFASAPVTTLTPPLLLEKARAIQLAGDSAGLTLDDARSSIRQATMLAPHIPDAWIELGHFYFAVDDDAAQALVAFHHARACMKPGVVSNDLTLGEAKALVEAGRSREALALVDVFPAKEASAELLQLHKELVELNSREVR
ncbi:hypothetical protein BH11PSE7_BH11PSE7_06020 [soil metagenome]